MTIFDKIAALKVDDQDEAFKKALKVHTDEGVFIGYLVPIGPWVLSHPGIIESLMRWRERYMKFFLTQFQVSLEKTTAFVKNVPIAKDDRLLFLIYDETKSLKGHIGIADVREGHLELDNLIRGEKGGHQQLIYFSEQTTLDWAYTVLGVETVGLEVLSFNAPTIKLHSRFGFELTEAKPMHKSETADVLTLAYCTPEETNVDFTCNAMRLTRDDFREQFGPSLFEAQA